MQAKKKRSKLGYLTVPIRVCAREGCGQTILTTYAAKVYCSSACRTAAHRAAKAELHAAAERKAELAAAQARRAKGGAK